MLIEFSMKNHKRHEKRLNTLQASMKMVEIQVKGLAAQLQKQENGRLPSQNNKEKAITILWSGTVLNNYFPKITNNVSLAIGNKNGDQEEQVVSKEG